MLVGSADRNRRRVLSPWWGIATLVLAMCATWSLAMPLMASPDEPSHTIKAASVVRGQLAGTVGPAPVDDTQPGAPTYVSVPNDLAATTGLADCFRFNDETAASCQPSLPTRTGGLIETVTYAGQYPPLYYALVGWPSLFLTGEAAVYAMRLVSGALSTALIVWGLRRFAVRESRRGMWGALVALTPMCFFMAGTINPNGLEIAAAFCFWSACTALSMRAGPPATALFIQAAVSGAILVNVRASGAIWAALIVAFALLIAAPAALRALVRAPAARWAALVAVAASVTAVAWIATHGEIVSTSGMHPEFAEPRLIAAVMLLSTEVFFEQMVGNFGWLDTAAPFPTVLAWIATTSTLALLAFALPTTRRRQASLVLLAGAVVLVPIALTIPTADAAGIVWQGRYVLPLAVGVPLVAALLLSPVRGASGHLLDRVHAVTIPLIGLGHVVAFYWASRRYSTGVDGFWITWSPEWQSPVGFIVGTALYAALVCGLGWAAWSAVPGAPTVTPAAGPAGGPG